MIYYFSGTGNSRWVAEELARRTGDEARDIPGLMKDGPTAVSIGAGARIGIVFPVYAWGAPRLVEQFCRSISIAGGAYAYAVCTCGDEAGRAVKRLRRAFPWQSAWSIAMPNNYVVGFDVDGPELEQKKIAAARARLAQIADAILAAKQTYDVHQGAAAGLKTAVVRPMFNAFARRTKPFYATNACSGCGLCERICPTQAIRLENGRPSWAKTRCAQCMGCINRCPEAAIQYGPTTRKHGRYVFPAGE